MMKRILILMMVFMVGVFANEIKFFEPSFSCSKVKKESIEYKICTDEVLAKLDKQLSEYYSDVKIIDDRVKQTQRDWMKERNSCKDNSCIKEAYISRIDELANGIEKFVKKLKKADEEAKASYEKDKNVYTAIAILKAIGMKELIDKQPSFFCKKEYVDMMQNYASYYIGTKHDMAHKLNLDYAKKVLDLAIKSDPKSPNSYKVLGEMYLDYFRFTRTPRNVCPICEEYSDDNRWRFMPYKMKEAYTQYMTLCKEQSIKPKLSKEEQTIVKRNQIFIDYYSTFKGQPLTYINPPKIDEELMYKKGFENICSEYVEMLNALPEDNLIRCSRYVNEPDSKFKHILEDKAPQRYKKNITPDSSENVYAHLFKYSGEYFYDAYGSGTLILANQIGKEKGFSHLATYPENTCYYQYVDLREKDQTDLNYVWIGNGTYDCSSIRNYRKKYIAK